MSGTLQSPASAMTPLEPIEGYLPLEDHGLIGDGETAALVSRGGEIVWMCLPDFEDPPLFCRILDTARGGGFTVAPAEIVEARQTYIEDSGVLVTEMRSPSGVVRLTDLMTFRCGADLIEGSPAARRELLRCAQVIEGSVRLKIVLEPWGGARAQPSAAGWRIRCNRRPGIDLHLSANRPLDAAHTEYDLHEGDRLDVVLSWGTGGRRYHPYTPEQLLASTLKVWRSWIEQLHYHGPRQRLVRRSAITLKLLDYLASGALLAAPTSSLPEAIGGVRNWDYRYTWVRDAAFSVYALRRIDLEHEAAAFLGWVLDAVDRNGRPCVMYDLQGNKPPPEKEEPRLEGYRRSQPVRWGNAAADQRQHDVFGEILDCAYQWASDERQRIDPRLWKRLQRFVAAARREWHQPDHGIWEVRTSGRPFTYSAAMCQVALDRGARLAERFGLPGNVKAWRKEAAKIAAAILDEAWDPRMNSLTEYLGGGALDASLLALPLRRVIPADHPKMTATAAAIAERLGAGGGLLFRYDPDQSPDGLEGHEGAFLLCSFWYVENLVRQGRLEEALELFDSLCDRAGELGLLPEQIDPTTGAFLGNYPQAFSHVGLISSGANLARAMGEAHNAPA